MAADSIQKSSDVLLFSFAIGAFAALAKAFAGAEFGLPPPRLWAQLGLVYSSRYFLNPTTNPPPTLARRPVGLRSTR